MLVVLVACVLGAAFSAVNATLDYRAAREDLDQSTKQLLSSVAHSIALAMARYDRVLASRIAVGLLEVEFVTSVRILNADGANLATATKYASLPAGFGLADLLSPRPVVETVPLEYREGGQYLIGSLQLTASPAFAFQRFLERLALYVSFAFAGSFLLGGIVLYAFNTMIARPVRLLSQQLERFDPEKPVVAELPDAQAFPKNELGFLANKYRDLVNVLVVRLSERDQAVYQAERESRAKSTFLATMSHEIRTPLNAVIGFAEVLEMGIGDDSPEARKEKLHYIASSGRSLNSLLSDLLDYSRIESEEFDVTLEVLQPSDVVIEFETIFRHMCDEYSTEMRMAFENAKSVLVDKGRLVQILMNLVSNAAKYNRPGGHVEIGAFDTPDGNVRIYVQDEGIGIDPDQAESLFAPFARGRETKADTAGFGLGLAICKQLTEKMNGKIGFASEKGMGSTFWVEFPAEH